MRRWTATRCQQREHRDEPGDSILMSLGYSDAGCATASDADLPLTLLGAQVSIGGTRVSRLLCVFGRKR